MHTGLFAFGYRHCGPRGDEVSTEVKRVVHVSKQGRHAMLTRLAHMGDRPATSAQTGQRERSR